MPFGKFKGTLLIDLPEPYVVWFANEGFPKEIVLQQYCIDGYRAIQSVQDKAWVEGNGYSLDKSHNAVLDVLGYSLRASQKAVIHVVALFVKGAPFSAKHA